MISHLEFTRLYRTFVTCYTAVIAQIIDNSLNTGAENLSSSSVYSIIVTDMICLMSHFQTMKMRLRLHFNPIDTEDLGGNWPVEVYRIYQ